MGSRATQQRARGRSNDAGPGYALLADMSRCSNCGACMLACKEYNDYKFEKTDFTPSGCNPPDLSSSSVLAVHGFESDINGKPYVRFQRVACYHCRRPACLEVCPVKGCIVRNAKTGAVVIDESKCAGCRFCVHACPFEVPRMGKHPANKKREVAIKCNLCHDRIKLGESPACAAACPTGALFWGKRSQAIDVADARLGVLRDTFAREVGGRRYISYGKETDPHLKGLGVFMILEEDSVEQYRRLPDLPRVPVSVANWKGLFKLAAGLVPGLVVVFAFLHYMFVGPLGVHVVEEEEEVPFEELSPEEQEKALVMREREIKAKRRAGKGKRLYQPMPPRRGRTGGPSKGRGRPPKRRRK